MSSFTKQISPGVRVGYLIGDARVVRRGDFLGVVASREYDAIQAAAVLKVVYAEPPEISGRQELLAAMVGIPQAMASTMGRQKPS